MTAMVGKVATVGKFQPFALRSTVDPKGWSQNIPTNATIPTKQPAPTGLPQALLEISKSLTLLLHSLSAGTAHEGTLATGFMRARTRDMGSLQRFVTP
jgi:hypothetical protein